MRRWIGRESARPELDAVEELPARDDRVVCPGADRAARLPLARDGQHPRRAQLSAEARPSLSASSSCPVLAYGLTPSCRRVSRAARPSGSRGGGTSLRRASATCSTRCYGRKTRASADFLLVNGHGGNFAAAATRARVGRGARPDCGRRSSTAGGPASACSRGGDGDRPRAEAHAELVRELPVDAARRVSRAPDGSEAPGSTRTPTASRSAERVREAARRTASSQAPTAASGRPSRGRSGRRRRRRGAGELLESAWRLMPMTRSRSFTEWLEEAPGSCGSSRLPGGDDGSRTADADGRPIGADGAAQEAPDGRGFTFFCGYESRKAASSAEEPARRARLLLAAAPADRCASRAAVCGGSPDEESDALLGHAPAALRARGGPLAA
jgi:hypothetical protein